MVKGKIKLLKEAVSNIFNPVTIDYPAGTWPGNKYSQIPLKLRGKQKFDEEKCIGCGGCMVSCSSHCISLEDKDAKRTISVFLGQCIFCGRCEEVCPEEAITLTPEFELAYTGPRESEGVYVRHKVDLSVCEECGEVIAPTLQISRFKERVTENIDPSIKEIISKDMEKYAKQCINCRRLQSYELATHTRKFY